MNTCCTNLLGVFYLMDGNSNLILIIFLAFCLCVLFTSLSTNLLFSQIANLSRCITTMFFIPNKLVDALNFLISYQ